jgi:hypothetical protein
VHASYDADAVRRFLAALVEIERVLKVFRSGFVRQASPIHLFWGGLDLAHTRFSGRTAPKHRASAPDWTARDGRRTRTGVELRLLAGCRRRDVLRLRLLIPPGYRDQPVEPGGARWDDDLGEFVTLQAGPHPPRTPARLLAFARSTYEAAAKHGRLGCAALEATLTQVSVGERPTIAAAEDRDRAVLAHDDHGGGGVVERVAAGRRVAVPPRSRPAARQPGSAPADPELPEDAIVVERRRHRGG